MGKSVVGALALLLVCSCASGSGAEGMDGSGGLLPPEMMSGPVMEGASPSPGSVGASGAGGVGMGMTAGARPMAMAGSGPVVMPPMAGGAGGGAPPVAGAGAPTQPGGAGAPDQPTGGMAAPAPTGSKDPVIPAVTGDCPTFNEGIITFMGLGGILVDSGPKPPTPTAPMVFYWHGTGLTASAYVRDLGPILQGVKSEGGVVVAFEGTTGGDLTSGTFIFGESDFKLTDQLVACAVAEHNVDPRRIYATGCSAGGLFSAAMATERSSYIAAAAPNSGGWVVPLAFDSMNTPALMTVHGAPGVDVVVIDFSVSSATADDGFKQRGGFVVNCNTGGAHCGGSYLAGAMWDFFKAHPYGVDPHPWDGGLPSGFAKECKIY